MKVLSTILLLLVALMFICSDLFSAMGKASEQCLAKGFPDAVVTIDPTTKKFVSYCRNNEKAVNLKELQNDQ